MCPQAIQALQRAGGDITYAQAILFEKKMLALRASNPELFTSMIEQRSSTSMQLEMNVHSKLVEVSWDVVGSFLSMQPLNPAIADKCQMIATACIAPEIKEETCAVLDVGCGDGVSIEFINI